MSDLLPSEPDPALVKIVEIGGPPGLLWAVAVGAALGIAAALLSYYL